MIYVFVLIALILLWVPAVAHVDRFPYAVGFGALALGTAACFAVMVLRLPREARRLVRRTLRTRRVATALAVAIAGVTVAFTAVAFVPSPELPQTLPVAIVITIAARMAATSRLRSPLARKQPGPSTPGTRR